MIITSHPNPTGQAALEEVWDTLAAGGSALDAVERGHERHRARPGGHERRLRRTAERRRSGAARCVDHGRAHVQRGRGRGNREHQAPVVGRAPRDGAHRPRDAGGRWGEGVRPLVRIPGGRSDDGEVSPGLASLARGTLGPGRLGPAGPPAGLGGRGGARDPGSRRRSRGLSARTRTVDAWHGERPGGGCARRHCRDHVHERDVLEGAGTDRRLTDHRCGALRRQRGGGGRGHGTGRGRDQGLFLVLHRVAHAGRAISAGSLRGCAAPDRREIRGRRNRLSTGREVRGDQPGRGLRLRLEHW